MFGILNLQEKEIAYPSSESTAEVTTQRIELNSTTLSEMLNRITVVKFWLKINDKNNTKLRLMLNDAQLIEEEQWDYYQWASMLSSKEIMQIFLGYQLTPNLTFNSQIQIENPNELNVLIPFELNQWKMLHTKTLNPPIKTKKKVIFEYISSLDMLDFLLWLTTQKSKLPNFNSKIETSKKTVQDILQSTLRFDEFIQLTLDEEKLLFDENKLQVINPKKSSQRIIIGQCSVALFLLLVKTDLTDNELNIELNTLRTTENKPLRFVLPCDFTTNLFFSPFYLWVLISYFNQIKCENNEFYPILNDLFLCFAIQQDKIGNNEKLIYINKYKEL